MLVWQAHAKLFRDIFNSQALVGSLRRSIAAVFFFPINRTYAYFTSLIFCLRSHVVLSTWTSSIFFGVGFLVNWYDVPILGHLYDSATRDTSVPHAIDILAL